jgi:hypothetical protein
MSEIGKLRKRDVHINTASIQEQSCAYVIRNLFEEAKMPVLDERSSITHLLK